MKVKHFYAVWTLPSSTGKQWRTSQLKMLSGSAGGSPSEPICHTLNSLLGINNQAVLVLPSSTFWLLDLRLTQGRMRSTTRMQEAPREAKKAFQPNFSTSRARGTPALAAPATRLVVCDPPAHMRVAW